MTAAQWLAFLVGGALGALLLLVALVLFVWLGSRTLARRRKERRRARVRYDEAGGSERREWHSRG